MKIGVVKMSELETKVRGYLQKYPLWPAWEIADVSGCSERTVRRVRQNIRKEKEFEFCNKINTMHQKPDMVNSPPHYTVGGIETIDYIQAKLTPEEFRGYLLGNSLKYLSRLGKKSAVSDDLGKAAWYIKKLSEVV